MQLTGSFPDFYNETMLPAINMVGKAVASQQKPVYPLFFDMRSSVRGIEQYSSVMGVNRVGEIAEGGRPMADRAVPGFSVTFRHRKFGIEIPTTLEAIEDDRFGLVVFAHQSAFMAIRTARETHHAAHFNRAFNASFPGPDGKPLIATDHPLRSGTQSNRRAIDADLSYESLAAALTDLYLQRDYAGNFITSMMGKLYLVVAPAGALLAHELCKSPDRPDTANRARNVLSNIAGSGMPTPVVWPFLATAAGGDDNAWFLVASGAMRGLVSYDRRKPYSDNHVDPFTETGTYFIRYRLSSGWEHPFGIYGSPGA